jgi:enoyl-CoA hydratase
MLLVERRNDVAIVTLNRPEKRNALSLELRALLAETLAELAADDSVGGLVLTGAGTAFCSGMDVTEFGGDRAHKERLVELSVAAFRAVGAFPKPALAAVNGPAIAGGFALALLCDVRIAARGAILGFGEPPGVPPSYAAARAALPAALARELTLTGRRLDGGVAERLGVVAEVTEPGDLLERAAAVANTMAAAGAAAITKSRILLEREQLFGPLFAEEEQRLREALLG